MGCSLCFDDLCERFTSLESREGFQLLFLDMRSNSLVNVSKLLFCKTSIYGSELICVDRAYQFDGIHPMALAVYAGLVDGTSLVQI